MEIAAGTTIATTPALALHGITKRFGATEALSNASLTVAPGTLHALLGENGAGKTTLMRIAFGLLRPDAGQVAIAGRTVSLGSPADAIALGVGMVHQHFTSVPAMTVAENVALGGHGLLDVQDWRRRVQVIAEQNGLELDPNARVADLSVSALQRLEIIKALASGARTLVLDEPSSVLAPAEIDELARMMQRLVSAGGSVVLITHKLREALAIADEVTVLRRGRTVMTAKACDVSESTLVSAMLGEDQLIASRDGRRTLDADGAASMRDVVLDVRGLGVRDDRGVSRVRDATFTVRAGEIVGIAAVEGAGQHELLRALAGIIAPTSGAIECRGAIGFIPENRQRDALVLDFGLDENVALHGAGARRGHMNWRAITRRTTQLMTEYDVRAPDAHVRARALSGGNQQKLVIARELDSEPVLLIAENPTHGLDIGASAATHARLRAARDSGNGVIVYSSDLDEVLTLSDRVIVVHGGVTHEMPLDRDAIGRAMLGTT